MPENYLKVFKDNGLIVDDVSDLVKEKSPDNFFESLEEYLTGMQCRLYYRPAYQHVVFDKVIGYYRQQIPHDPPGVDAIYMAIVQTSVGIYLLRYDICPVNSIRRIAYDIYARNSNKEIE